MRTILVTGRFPLFGLTASDAAADFQNRPGAPWLWPGALLAAIGVIGALQYLTPQTLVHWLYVLHRAYYVPIVLASLSGGWRRGLIAALLSGGAFAVGTPSIWEVPRVNVLDQCLEICVFCLVGLITGILIDRQKKQEHALHDATGQLREAHQELRENFDSMKRPERLYALGQLSAGLAHEIRNPLASIEGAATVLQRESPSADRRIEFLEIIQKESRRLNRLLTRFLNFARPAEPDLEVVNIDDLLDSVINLMRHAEGNGRFEMKKDIQPGVSMMECDPQQMKQVLLNLVMNSVQAMPYGGTVALAVRRDGSRINIEVQDQGTGISEENIERVFDPFFTTKENGTGLGLPVAHQIVSKHGGKLTIPQSSPEGVTVRISLPLRLSHSHEQKPDSRN